MSSVLIEEAVKTAGNVRRADIVIGIPSYKNARTVGHVVRAAHAGLAKYFPQFESVIINSDGEQIERLCLSFEQLKPYLTRIWPGSDRSDVRESAQPELEVRKP